MLLYAIRHGQSEANANGLLAGWIDVALTQRGIAEAEAMRGYLADIPFDKIYASDLLRARQTAAAAMPGCTPEITPLLRELGVGSIEGIPVSECREKYGDTFTSARLNGDYAAFGGESSDELYARAEKFFRLAAASPYRCVGAFVHECMLRAMLGVTLGAHLSASVTPIPNCAVAVFSLDGDRRQLISWNPDTK